MKLNLAVMLQVGFGEVSEREMVIQTACKRGWIPPPLPHLDSAFVSLTIEVQCHCILLRLPILSCILVPK